MPPHIHGIPPDTTDLGAYATPKANTLKLLSNLLIHIIFKASKA
jgi:hypothetical protein